LKPERVKKLTELLKKHSPKYVIFYSLTYLKEWTDVIGVTPTKVTKGMYIAKVDNTICCVIPQGAYPGMSYERIHEFAEKVLEHAK
jgi:hypothetical protein